MEIRKKHLSSINLAFRLLHLSYKDAYRSVCTWHEAMIAWSTIYRCRGNDINITSVIEHFFLHGEKLTIVLPEILERLYLQIQSIDHRS